MMPRIIVYKPEKEDEYFIVKIIPFRNEEKKKVIIFSPSGERREYEVKEILFSALKRSEGKFIGSFSNSLNLKADFVRIIGNTLHLYL